METILILGPPGAGKTSLIHRTLKQQALRGRTAIICNDDGTNTTTDAQIMSSLADVRIMNSGCFGCRDEREFCAVVNEISVSRHYDYLLIEPLGFIAGHEVPALLRGLGIEPIVITLVDVRYFQLNLALAGVVPSQLAAATNGVGLTKYPADISGLDDVRIEEVLVYIGRHAPGLPIFLVPPDGIIPAGLLATAHGKKGAVCTHGCHQHHYDQDDHQQHAHHDHGFVTQSFALRPEVTFADVRETCRRLPYMPFRVKGAVAGRQFNAVHGEWSLGEEYRTSHFLTLYLMGTVPLDHSWFTDIVDRSLVTVQEETKTLVRSTAGVSDQATADLLEEIFQRLPRQAVITEAGLVTNPEDHELLNEVRKRPGVSPETNARAIRARVEYYLMAERALTSHPTLRLNPACDQWERDLAIGIGWFAYNKSRELGNDLMREVAQVDLAGLLADGLCRLTRLNSNLERAFVFTGETEDVLRFIAVLDESLKDAVRYVYDLAKRDGRPELVTAWHGLVGRWCSV